MAIMWHYDAPENGVLRVRIDCEDQPVNALSRPALEELRELIAFVSGNTAVKGVIFRSGKPGNFIAGADLKAAIQLASSDEAKQLSQFGQRVFSELENLTIPTVALISGACLGGGLEFALACKYRIADTDPKTQLALPEVQLGLLPGWGGTIRLPRLIGFLNALPLILTGRRLRGYAARSKGLVDDVVPREAIESVGERIIATLRDARSEQIGRQQLFGVRKQPLLQRLMVNNGLVAGYALKKARQQVMQETGGHYPAPLRILDVLAESRGRNYDVAALNEAEGIAELAMHPVTRECIRLFFLQEDAKRVPADVAVPPVNARVAAVIGAGAMGAGIALLLAKKGIRTRLKDIKTEFLSAGMLTIHKAVSSSVKRRSMSKLEAQETHDLISPTTDYNGLRNADIVIEAIVENLAIKKSVFQELAAATNPDTVLATNTSSLRVADIADGVPHPERVVGIHFFNPPHKMPLVEIVRTASTSPEALATSLELVKRLGKTGVIVGDCVGFLVNRLLAPYMNEAGYLLTEVDDPLEIDRAAVEFGMPMGPLELADLVGLEVSEHVMANMHKAYGDRMKPAPIWGRLGEMRNSGGAAGFKLVIKNRKGKRTINPLVRSFAGHGADESSQSGQKPQMSRKTIIDRLIFPIINEAALCLAEQIASKPADVDLAMVFGTGFAPFRGGPLNYADSVGLNHIVQSLEANAKGRPWLQPSDALRRFAASGNGFHGATGRSEQTDSRMSRPLTDSDRETQPRRSAAVGAQPVPDETLKYAEQGVNSNSGSKSQGGDPMATVLGNPNTENQPMDQQDPTTPVSGDELEKESFVETALKLGGKSEEEARTTGAVDLADEQVEKLFAPRYQTTNSPAHLAVWSDDLPIDLFTGKKRQVPHDTQKVMLDSYELIRTRRLNDELYDENNKLTEDTLNALGKAGYWGLLVDREYGGLGASFVSFAKFLTRMATIEPTVAGLASVHGCIGAVDPLRTFGNDEQKKRFLPLLASGQKLSAFALTEPCAGSDLTALRTTATLDGDHYVVNGEKLFITNAVPGRLVGLVCLVDGKPAVLIADLPEQENDQFQIVKYGLYALRQSYNQGLKFNNFRVPKENLLVPDRGNGLTVAYHGLNRGRVALCANAAGVMRVMLASILPWAKFRRTYGESIEKRELVRRRIGRLAGMIVGCDALVEWCSSLLDEGYRGEMECIVAKIMGSEMQKEAAIEIFMKTHGGRAFLEGHLFGDSVHEFLAPCIYEGEGEMLGMAFFKSLIKEHGTKFFEPIGRALNEAGIRTPNPLNPMHAWALRKAVTPYLKWRAGQFFSRRTRAYMPPMSKSLRGHAEWAVARLHKSRLEIDSLMTKHQLSLADRQCSMADLSLRIQKMVLMLTTCLYASRQHDDELVQLSADVLCHELRRDISGGLLSASYFKTVTTLGKRIAEGEFSVLEGVQVPEILMKYET